MAQDIAPTKGFLSNSISFFVHPAGNFTTMVLNQRQLQGCSGTCAISQEMGEWQEGRTSCRSAVDTVGVGA